MALLALIYLEKGIVWLLKMMNYFDVVFYNYLKINFDYSLWTESSSNGKTGLKMLLKTTKADRKLKVSEHFIVLYI